MSSVKVAKHADIDKLMLVACSSDLQSSKAILKNSNKIKGSKEV